jgi:hypothetical protein
MRSGYDTFAPQLESGSKSIANVMEITMKNLLESSDLDSKDFLDRADVLAAIGQPVLITRYSEYFKMIEYLRRQTKAPIGLAVGAGALPEIFDPRYYTVLPGQIVEGLGKLFQEHVKLLVYPTKFPTGEILTVDSFAPSGDLALLYRYFRNTGQIVASHEPTPSLSSVTSADVLKCLRAKDPKWENMVPSQVAAIIKDRGLFGYTPD